MDLRTDNIDSTPAALRDYEREQDRLFAEQERIDELTAELYAVHSNDPADMAVELVEDHPEKAAEMLAAFLSDAPIPAETLKEHRIWFDRFVANRCEAKAKWAALYR